MKSNFAEYCDKNQWMLERHRAKAIDEGRTQEERPVELQYWESGWEKVPAQMPSGGFTLAEGLLVPSLLTRLVSNPSQGSTEKTCNLFTCCCRKSWSKDQCHICQSIKAKWWKFKCKQGAESQTLTCGSQKGYLSCGLLFSTPAVRESRVRSTPRVADSSPVALDGLSLLRDPCEKCNLIDFTVFI